MFKNRIVLLVNNDNDCGFLKEHGFSLLIESQEINVLFDTGQGKTLNANSIKKSINWNTLQGLILSHGHYDHTGGIPFIIGKCPSIQIYAHKDILTRRYHFITRDSQLISKKDISITDKARQCLSNHANLKWIDSAVMLSPHVGITGPILRKFKDSFSKEALYVSEANFEEDVVEDEMALWIDSKDGLIIITGCCHAGLKNTIEAVKSITKKNRIHILVGGFHLRNSETQEINEICTYLNTLSIDLIIPCHCTGSQATDIMKKLLQTSVRRGLCGDEWTFELK